MKNFKPILTAMSLCMALAAAAAPVRQHLHDDWQFRQARLNNWYPATVPGTVHTDLMANRIIEDPYFRLNERGVQWVDKEDWIYETHFEADAGLLAREQIELVFEGLDTYADVYLNDEKVLAADNMFRRWRTEVKRLLRPGENTLKVYFHSPIKVDLPKYDSLPYRYEAVNDQSANGGLFDKRVSVFARKAGYHYGWDWGPRLVTSGIWRPVYLEGWSGARISDVFYRQQEVTARRARVEVEVEIASARDLAEAVVTVASPGEGIEASVTAPLRSGINKVTVPLDIASPKLWWTRELGESHLYEFRASVAAGDASDSRTTRIGLRSLRLVRDKVADGTTFYFELNGEPLFAKGANYIPCDVFLPRVTRAVYEKTIDDAAAVNMNMLRVWGGGVYEDDVFYELCDERGILVWQDFMFACSVYPAEGAWLENVRLEAEDNIRRLRNHPSIAVWCGNNECNEAWFGWGWNTRYAKQGHPEWDRIIGDQLRRQYYEVLPEAVAACSPGTPYHPSSPWSRHEGTSENSEGDTHFWKVWHSRAPIADYNATRSRFFSEYGFQSFPEYASVLRFAPRRARLGHRIGGDDGPSARRRFRQHAHPPIPRRRILARTRFPHVPLHEPRFAGRRHQDRHRGAPARQTLLLGIALLAAQRLLARGFVGQPRLVRPLEGATLFRPPGLRRHPRIAPCRGKRAERPPCVGPPQNGPGETPDNGHGHGRRPPLGKHPQPNRRTQCQSERLFGRHFRTFARLRPQSGDRRRGIHDRRTPLRQHRIFRLSKRA